MPCRSDGYPDPKDEANGKLQSTIAKQKNEIDFLTNLLCEVLTGIESFASHDFRTYLLARPKLNDWWQKHKKLDVARKAIEKLTDEERIELLAAYVKENGRLP